MSKIRDALTVDYDGFVIVEKDYESIVFDSIEDFYFRAPEHIGVLDAWKGQFSYLFYSPDQKHFSDFRDGNELSTLPEEFEPIPEYEAIISMFDTLSLRQSDIYFGLDQQGQMRIGQKAVGEMIFRLLRSTDYTLLVDSPFTPTQQASIIAWRNELRTYIPKLTTVDQLKNTTTEILIEMLDPELHDRISNPDSEFNQ